MLIWFVSSRAPKGLNLQRVIRAARAEIDAVGLDAASLRGVARRLNVQAPALYWYVKDKRQLINSVGTELWRPAIEAAVTAASCGTHDPGVVALTYARALRTSIGTCRDGARIIGSTRLEDASLLQSMEDPLANYAEGNGVEEFVTLIQAAQHATIGFCLSEQLAMTSHELELRAQRLGHAPLVAAIGEATIGPADDRFEAMLRLLVRP